MNCCVTSSTDQVMACSHSPQFAMFFADGAGFGIEMVQALDAAHAQDIALAPYPKGLSAVPAELLDSQDRHKLLAAWLKGEG